MFSFISDLKFIATLSFVIALIVLAIILCSKFPVFRYIFGFVIFFVILISGLVSGFYLNAYYNSAGGIKGKIGSLLKPNVTETIITETDLTIKVNNVTLIKQIDESYLADIQVNETISLDIEKNYVMYFNGSNADIIEYSSQHLKGSFTQLFYLNKDLTETTIRKIDFVMFFYGNYVDIDLYVDSDVDSVSLWNSYFDRNGCNIQIKSCEKVNSEFFNVLLKFGDTIISQYKIKQGSNFILPETYSLTGYHFNYWQLNDSMVSKITNIQEDTIIYANMTKLIKVSMSLPEYNVILAYVMPNSDYVLPETLSTGYYDEDLYYFNGFKLNGEYVTEFKNLTHDVVVGVDLVELVKVYYFKNYENDSNSDFYLSMRQGKGNLISLPDIPKREFYEFLGWSFDKENVFDFSNYVLEDSINLYAIWNNGNIPVQVKLNGGSLDYNGVTYTTDFEISQNYTSVLEFANPVKENVEFFNFICREEQNQKGQSYSLTTLSLSPESIYEDIYGGVGNNVYDPDKIDEEAPITCLVIEIQWFEYDDSDEYETRKKLVEQLGLTSVPPSGTSYIETPNEALLSNELCVKTIYEHITGETIIDEMTDYEIISFVLSAIDEDVVIDESVTYTQAIYLIAENLGLND